MLKARTARKRPFIFQLFRWHFPSMLRVSAFDSLQSTCSYEWEARQDANLLNLLLKTRRPAGPVRKCQPREACCTVELENSHVMWKRFKGVLTRNFRVTFFSLLWVPASPVIIEWHIKWLTAAQIIVYGLVYLCQFWFQWNIDVASMTRRRSRHHCSRRTMVSLDVRASASKRVQAGRGRICLGRITSVLKLWRWYILAREAWRQQFEARHSTHHTDADVKRVSILSFLMCVKIEIDLRYVILNSYCWNFWLGTYK